MTDSPSPRPSPRPSPQRGEGELALYIHWPFCVSKCPYCDFNSHVREGVDQVRWRDALLADLAHEAALTPGKRLTSIFFGGGTPSLMPPATVAALLAAAEQAWGFAPGIEITLEANPSSVEAARFADLAGAGVNRLSLGLQALDDASLRFLGRAHDVEEAMRALGIAQKHFARTSVDLIYALPDQTEVAWEADLARAIGFGTEHLSLYQLTIEPGTRFATLAAQGKLTEMDADHQARMFELTRAQTAAAGLPAYEVSNHARLGAESRHNLTYWRYGDYAGIGPGAHGRRGDFATQRAKKPENWLTRIDARGDGIEEEAAQDAQTRRAEALLMGLRLAEGVDLTRLGEGVDLAAAGRLAGHGLLELAGDRLTVKPGGMLVLNAIIAEIVR